MKVVHPFMLVDGDREAMEFQLEPGTYDDTLTEGSGRRYVEGDLVEVNGGTVRKAQATPGQLYLAGADWHQPFAFQYLLDAGVPLNVIPSRNQFVFSMNAGSGDHAFTQANKNAVLARETRDLVWNAAEECLVVHHTTNTNGHVTLLGIFKGDVGDNNVQVIARINSAAGA